MDIHGVDGGTLIRREGMAFLYARIQEADRVLNY